MTTKPYKPFTGEGSGKGPRNYIISKRDALLVDLAIKIGRPLLVEGEAGCGKTRLAHAIAEELELEKGVIEMPVRSSARANDLFYRFDALRRLQESNLEARREYAKFAYNYVDLEPIGEAINEGYECVILIDEVDKGDMDFQNDLLFALERFQFDIDEIPAHEAQAAKARGFAPRMGWTGGKRPIVVFTSNRERQLPKPFLRRCIYLELEFPGNADDLTEIVTANLRLRRERREPGSESLADLNDGLIRAAVESFLGIRVAAQTDNAIKMPATAELLDWVHALHLYPDARSGLDTLTPSLWQVLFRNAEDLHRHARHASGASGDAGANS